MKRFLIYVEFPVANERHALIIRNEEDLTNQLAKLKPKIEERLKKQLPDPRPEEITYPLGKGWDIDDTTS